MYSVCFVPHFKVSYIFILLIVSSYFQPFASQYDPLSIKSLVLSIYVICYFWKKHTPTMYTYTYTHTLTIWPILAQTGAQVVQRRNAQQ